MKQSTAELSVYRVAGELTDYRPPNDVDLAVGDSLSATLPAGAAKLLVTPNATNVVGLDRSARLSVRGRGIQHLYDKLVAVDRSLPEGTPLFKNGKLAGLTLLGRRFPDRSFVVPVDRIASLLLNIIQSSETTQPGERPETLTADQVVAKGQALSASSKSVTVRFHVAGVNVVNVSDPNDASQRWELTAESNSNRLFSNFSVVLTPEALAALKRLGVVDVAKHFTGKLIEVTGRVHATSLNIGVGLNRFGLPNQIWTYHINVDSLDQLREPSPDGGSHRRRGIRRRWKTRRRRLSNARVQHRGRRAIRRRWQGRNLHRAEGRNHAADATRGPARRNVSRTHRNRHRASRPLRGPHHRGERSTIGFASAIAWPLCGASVRRRRRRLKSRCCASSAPTAGRWPTIKSSAGPSVTTAPAFPSSRRRHRIRA